MDVRTLCGTRLLLNSAVSPMTLGRPHSAERKKTVIVQRPCMIFTSSVKVGNMSDSAEWRRLPEYT